SSKEDLPLRGVQGLEDPEEQIDREIEQVGCRLGAFAVPDEEDDLTQSRKRGVQGVAGRTYEQELEVRCGQRAVTEAWRRTPKEIAPNRTASDLIRNRMISSTERIFVMKKTRRTIKDSSKLGRVTRKQAYDAA